MRTLTRKEICENLGISEAYLRKKIKELNIQCVKDNDSSRLDVKHDDYLRIMESCNITKEKVEDETENLALVYLKAELINYKIKNDALNSSLIDKDRIIDILMEDKKALEQKNEKLLNEFIKLNSRKGFFSKLFKSGKD